MPPKTKTTNVGNRDIPFETGNLVTAEFLASPEWADEKGTWEFWTAFKGEKVLTVRCRQGADPGERFRDMKNNEAEENGWLFVSSEAQAIRPATMMEVVSWLSIKPQDTPYLQSLRVCPFVL